MTGRASAFQRSVVNENLDVFEHLYDEEEVQELFSRAGFRDVRIHTRTGSGEHLYIVEGWR
jgi:capsular polysaccharide biosynthesis protein